MSPINLGINAGSNDVLPTADFYAQAKNYSGSGDWLDESGNGHNFRLGSASGSDTNDPTFLEYNGTTYVYMSGTTGNYASTTDKAQLDITGDIDLICHIEPVDWTPGTAHALMTKWGSTNAARSFYWLLNTNGTISLYWFDGTTTNVATSTVATGFTDGTAHWIRTTLDVDNGGGAADITFYTSDDGSSWTQLGAVVNHGSTTSINASTGGVRLGSIPFFIWIFQGKYHRAIIKDGINGTVVGDFNSAGQTNHTSWADAYGNTWTLSKSTNGPPTTLVDEDKFILGGNDYFEHADDSFFDFDSNQDFTLVAAYRKSTSSDIAIVTKQDANDGWALTTFFSFGAVSSALGGTFGSATTAATSVNARTILAGRRIAGANHRAYLNGSAGSIDSNNPSLDTSNSLPIRIGAYSDGSIFSCIEVMAIAIFKRQLTDSEIEKLNDELAQS